MIANGLFEVKAEVFNSRIPNPESRIPNPASRIGKVCRSTPALIAAIISSNKKNKK